MSFGLSVVVDCCWMPCAHAWRSANLLAMQTTRVTAHGANQVMLDWSGSAVIRVCCSTHRSKKEQVQAGTFLCMKAPVLFLR
jgi:hypothetical protein